MYEHADLTAPRREHGYCVDDVARGLVVVCRERDGAAAAVADLRVQYLEFVLSAQADDGRVRNRRDSGLRWTDSPTVEDCWGRTLWGLGTAVAGPGDAAERSRALAAFDRSERLRSPWSRAMAFAALGAAAVLEVEPGHPGARSLLRDAADRLTSSPAAPAEAWPWPEPRLTYANAAVPEVLVAAGALLGDAVLLADGLALLQWLLQLQSSDGHLSVVPVGGRDALGRARAFDQQPIEVAALADACARAYAVTGQQRWADGVDLAVAWFLGCNDSSTPLHDPVSGGGCDGLEHDGRNENQGAESTLALVSTLQHARADRR